MAAHASDWGNSLNPRHRGGQTAHHGGDVCCWVLLIVDRTFYYSYCRNSTGWEFFIPARKCFGATRTQIGFKLLSCMARTTQPMSMAVYMMVGSNMTKTTLSTSTSWWWHPCSRVDVGRGHKSQPHPLHGQEDALCVNMSHGLYQALREVAR
jgi:hypothetical protein